jgi:hypothetical protein
MRCCLRVAAFFVALLSISGSLTAQEASKPAAMDMRAEAARLRLRTSSAELDQRMVEVAKKAENAPSLRGMSPADRKELIEFVFGNMLFVLLHELGHVHIAEMGLPVLGQEEDAADSFAIISMLVVGSKFSDKVLMQATRGWFAAARRDTRRRVKPAFYDAHSLDQQRAFRVVCLLVGSNPEGFRQLANDSKLPQERQETCGADFSNAQWSWEKVLTPHLRNTDEPMTPIGTSYQDGGAAFNGIAQVFRDLGLLEGAANFASVAFRWRAPYALEMRSCGSPNSSWEAPSRKLVLCYELVKDFIDLYKSELSERARKRR